MDVRISQVDSLSRNFQIFQRNSFPDSVARRRNRARECKPTDPSTTRKLGCKLMAYNLKGHKHQQIPPVSNDRHQRNPEQCTLSFSQKEGSRSRSERMGGEVLRVD